MKRIVGTAAAAVGTCLLALWSPASGAEQGQTPTRVVASAARHGADSSRPPVGLMAPWAREQTRYGDRDAGPRHIEHVLELQYRLRWVGLYPGTPTGVFGPATRKGVQAFQARRHIPTSGTATTRTWRLLLQRTVRHPLAVPATCKTSGWHACYDRSMHQVTLWHNGSIYNTWLVRGGGYTTQTRTGTHKVYYRDIDHVSGLFGTPMPYSQFFDGGEALHGSVLMTSPFVDHSHGCVNMYLEDAHQLWFLTHDKVLWVTVYGAWS